MKKFFVIGFIVVLLVTIPLAVYLVKLNTGGAKSKAAPSTVLSAESANATVGVGDTVPVNIIADPGANAVSVVKLNLSYDSTKLATTAGGFVPNAAAFPTILDPVTYGPCTGNFCTITATLAIGADPTKAITTKTTVGTVSFKALATTETPTNVTFGNQTTVYSVAQADQASENVLSSTTPLALSIATSTASTSGTLTPTMTAAPTPTTDQTGALTPTSAANQPPLCTTLSVDSNSATPGGSINFTANGNSPGATISKVTFNFGDGNTLDVTDGGGLGTNNVSLQQAHTYATEGAYTATAIMTDVNSLISNSTTCSQVITIGTGSAIANNPTGTSKLPNTGPGDTLLAIGIVGAVLALIGGLLFFGL